MRGGGLCVVALAAAVLGPGETRAEERNVAFPVLLAEAEEPRGWALGPRPYRLDGEYWYGWEENGVQVTCAASACTPPGGSGTRRLYLSEAPGNTWSAGVTRGVPGVPVSVSEVDWGDALEEGKWSGARVVRVQVALFATLDEPQPSYEMEHLFGQGRAEVQALVATDEEPAAPLETKSTEATVYTPCARLTVQKLESRSLETRPSMDRFHWNAAKGEWEGAAATVYNRALWEEGEDTSGGGFSMALDARGRLLYAYTWDPTRAKLPAWVAWGGWYRLTLSLDGTAAEGRRCGARTLNTSLSEAGVEVGSVHAAVMAPELNLTYLDVYVPPLGGYTALHER